MEQTKIYISRLNDAGYHPVVLGPSGSGKSKLFHASSKTGYLIVDGKAVPESIRTDVQTQSNASTQGNALSRGVAEAQEALATSAAPIFQMDESAAYQEDREYATGWNSVWASDANRERFTDVVVDPKPYAGEGTGIRAFRERTGLEPGVDLMRLNFRRDHV